jgi:hypothetical protein
MTQGGVQVAGVIEGELGNSLGQRDSRIGRAEETRDRREGHVVFQNHKVKKSIVGNQVRIWLLRSRRKRREGFQLGRGSRSRSRSRNIIGHRRTGIRRGSITSRVIRRLSVRVRGHIGRRPRVITGMDHRLSSVRRRRGRVGGSGRGIAGRGREGGLLLEGGRRRELRGSARGRGCPTERGRLWCMKWGEEEKKRLREERSK